MSDPPAGDHPDAARGPVITDTALSDMRAELRRVRDGVDRLDAELERLARSGAVAAAPVGRRQRPERYYLVLVAVYECGPHGVAASRFAAIGAARGYDRRGLGGYFAGARAPLARDGDRVRLTTEGTRLVHEYLRGLDA